MRAKVVFERFFWLVLICLALAFFLFPAGRGGSKPTPNVKAPAPNSTTAEIAAELKQLSAEMERIKAEMDIYDPETLLERLRKLRTKIAELTAKLERQ